MLTKIYTLTILSTDSFFYKGLFDTINKSNYLSLKHLSSDPKDLLSFLNENSHDVEFCIIDTGIPQFENLNIEKFVITNPNLKILLVGQENTIQKIESQLSGVHGYFTKEINELNFLEALRSVRDQKEFNCNGFSSFGKKDKKKRFTEREMLFINYCATELSYNEIAERLYVSARTVEGYRERLFIKLNVKSRIGLVLSGLKNHLIDL